VHHANGATTDLVLGTGTTVKFQDDRVLLSSPSQTRDFSKTDVLRFTYTVLRSDVNGDGTVDVADIATVISTMASVGAGVEGDLQSTVPTRKEADVNGDGVVDVADIATIIATMAEMARMQSRAGTGPDPTLAGNLPREADVATTASGTIGEAFYIYRNDGQFNAFFRDEIDSIGFSRYNQDSLRYNKIASQVVYTPDSTYMIPLTAIDSVGFVQPETKYREDAVQITGKLFDYLISSDSLSLTFDLSIPSALLPKVGDKLVSTDLTEKLPVGFTGTVKQVGQTAGGYVVSCDSLALEEAVNRFYGVVEIIGQQSDGNVRRYLRRKAYSEHTRSFKLIIPPISDLNLDLTPFVKQKDVYDKNGKAVVAISISPVMTGRITRVVDNILNIDHYNAHIVTDVTTETNVEIVGQVVNKANPFNQSNHKKNFTIEGTKPGPYGIPIYYAFGPTFEMNGELALGTTVYANFTNATDITYYPLTTAIGVAVPGLSLLANQVNSVNGSTSMTHFDIDWAYIAGRISASVTVCGRLGIGLAAKGKSLGWVGCEAQIGAKAEAELGFDIEALSNAEKGTGFYDGIKDNAKVTVMPYWGLEGKVSVVDDRFQFTFLGRDDYSFWGKKWEWDFLPKFSNTKAGVVNGSNVDVSVNITNDCIIPYTVGFSLFDDDGNRIGDPQWNEQKFWTRNSFTFPFKTTFTDVATDKKYKAYPTLRLLGFNVLASPSASIGMDFPVQLSDFKVTNSQYQEGAFSNDGKNYDYCFNVSVTATLADDETDIADWGYVYLDPNGKEAFISLQKFGKTYTDTRWAYYRNEAKSTCTLYGYVKYVGSDEPVYGEPHDYTLVHGLACTDDQHPHLVDLGLPSGTLWYCINFGADKPEDWGGYYAFAELNEKNTYMLQNYLYYYNDTQFGGQYSYFENIGGNLQNFGTCISGKRGFDVVAQNWDNEGRMPTKEEAKELVDSCTWVWSFRNEVPGYEVTGPNGNSIFLPASGQKGQNTSYQGEPNRLTFYRTGDWSAKQWASQGFGYTWAIRFNQDTYELSDACAKAFGCVIRPVKSKEQ